MRMPVGKSGGLLSPRKPLAYQTLRKSCCESTANIFLAASPHASLSRLDSPTWSLEWLPTADVARAFIERSEDVNNADDTANYSANVKNPFFAKPRTEDLCQEYEQDSDDEGAAEWWWAFLFHWHHHSSRPPSILCSLPLR